MTREIKFRAWTLVSNKYQIHNLFGANFVRADLDYFLNPDFNGKLLELMQYTGLKDKNGKEIYEGDIVNNYYSPGLTEKLVLTEDIFFIVHRLKTILKNSRNDLNNGLEVIGNIYENPELLHG